MQDTTNDSSAACGQSELTDGLGGDRRSTVRRLLDHATPDPHDEREVLHAPLLREAAIEIGNLQRMLLACRSSVKFDLLYYEKMARAYNTFCAEGAVAEAEAQRLHELLAKIDALALTTPNLKVRGTCAASCASSPAPQSRPSQGDKR